MQECWASRTSPSGLRCKEVRQKQCGYQEEGQLGKGPSVEQCPVFLSRNVGAE